LFVFSVAFVVPALHAQQSFDQTLAALKSPDARARLAAVQQLTDARYPEAIAPVAPLVTDADDRVQLSAIAAELAIFAAERPSGRPSSVDAFVDVPFSVYALPVPRELTAALLAAMSDDNRQVRLDAAYTLGALARPPLSQSDAVVVIGALQHTDAATRAAAARVAGRLKVREAGDPLIAAMNDADADVRLAAVWALGELQFERAVESLGDFTAHYTRSELGLAALSALARIAHGSSVAMFRQALSDRSADVRRLAAEGLGRCRDAASIAALETLAASDPDVQVQAAALFALGRLGKASTPALADLLSHERASVAVRQYLLEAGATPGVLSSRLASADPRVRRGIVDVLGLVGGAGDVSAIAALQQDPDAAVRAASARALYRLKLSGKV
jgi:HEAT repeat protein